MGTLSSGKDEAGVSMRGGASLTFQAPRDSTDWMDVGLPSECGCNMASDSGSGVDSVLTTWRNKRQRHQSTGHLCLSEGHACNTCLMQC